MNSSDKIDALAKALIGAQREMKVADKSAVNPHFKSKYAPLPEVIEVAKVLLAHGIAFVQPTFDPAEQGRVGIETIIIHAESGQWISGALVLTPQQNNPQGIGSAITYGRRFGLASLVGIVAEEDDDGEAASSAEKPRKSAAPAKPVARPPAVAKDHILDHLPLFDPVATERRMHLELLAGFNTWDDKRAWRDRNKADKDLLPDEARLRVSSAFIASELTTKPNGAQAP